MQKNKLYLPHPPAKNKNTLRLPPLLNVVRIEGKNYGQNQNSFGNFEDSGLNNAEDKILADFIQKS